MCIKYRKAPSQIAINWLISQKNVVTICKASNKIHLRENLGAIGWRLEDSDIKYLKENFPGQKFISLADESWKKILAEG
jgi:diketogulonate reductase-like aldo/keto reductase